MSSTILIFVISLSVVFAVLLVFMFYWQRRQIVFATEKRTNELNKFKQVVEFSTDGIVITNREGTIVYVNGAWEKLTGYKRSEVYGKNPRILKSGKTPEDVYTQLWLSLEKGESFVTEDIVNRRKNGTEYEARLEAFPVREKNVASFYVGIETDITGRKKSEDAKTEFVSLASHQLRTPLSVIDWYAETLLSGSVGSLNNKQQSYVKEVYDTNQHMLRLVDTLLNTSRLELGTFSVAPEPTNLVKLGDDVIRELTPKINDKKLSVITEFGDDVPTVRVDKNLARIIFQNIISNSIRYTQSGGSIWVSVKLQKAGSRVKDRIISLDSVLITVQDSGIGIPKDQKGGIFTKLFRAQNAKIHHTGGTGLGLYIVKSILDQTNGSIWFESEEDVGSTFYVAIPVRGMHSKGHIQTITEDRQNSKVVS